MTICISPCNWRRQFHRISFRFFVGRVRKFVYCPDLIAQMDYAGAESFYIAFLVSLFIGMVLSIQISTEFVSLSAQPDSI